MNIKKNDTDNKTMCADLKTTNKSKAVCPVLDVISNNKVVIEFKNFGLIVNVNNAIDMKNKSVEIEYTGTIGKDDFKFEVRKCIK